MVEDMGDEQPLRRADLALRGAAEPGEVGPEPGLVDLARPALDSRVGTDPRRAQFAIVAHHPVALPDRRRRPLPAVEAAHPLAVAPQDMHQRAVQRPPEGAARLLT